MSMDTIVEHDHVDIDGDSYHEWWLEARRIYRDKNGRKHKYGMTAWLTMRCNNPSCPGAAIVRESALAAAFAPNGGPVAYLEQGDR